MCTKSITESALPNLENARSESELPMWRKSSTERLELNRDKPITDIWLPIRPKLRNASELPKCKKSKT